MPLSLLASLHKNSVENNFLGKRMILATLQICLESSREKSYHFHFQDCRIESHEHADDGLYVGKISPVNRRGRFEVLRDLDRVIIVRHQAASRTRAVIRALIS